MQRITQCAAGTAIALATCLPAAAAEFHSQQILILGSPLVSAQAISDSNTIVGYFEPSGTSFTTGFVLQGSALSALAGSFPSAVNRAGEVVGAGTHGGFLWKNGNFVSGVDFPITGQSGPPAVLLNRFGVVAYNSGTDSDQQVYAGTPQKPHLQKGLARFAAVSSINSKGVLAGFELATLDGVQTPAVFVGQNGLYDLLIPTGSSFDGITNAIVNDSGSVAFGAGESLYVYASANYTKIALPSAQANRVQVMGNNNSGRIVGTYTDNSVMPAVQTVFYYNGHNAAAVASYPAGDNVHVALNNLGVMVVSDIMAGNAGQMASYRFICSGSSC